MFDSIKRFFIFIFNAIPMISWITGILSIILITLGVFLYNGTILKSEGAAYIPFVIGTMLGFIATFSTLLYYALEINERKSQGEPKEDSGIIFT